MGDLALLANGESEEVLTVIDRRIARSSYITEFQRDLDHEDSLNFHRKRIKVHRGKRSVGVVVTILVAIGIAVVFAADMLPMTIQAVILVVIGAVAGGVVTYVAYHTKKLNYHLNHAK